MLIFFFFRFKKPKVKRKIKKIRQKLKAEDLLPLPGDKLNSSAHFGKRQRRHHDPSILDTDDVNGKLKMTYVPGDLLCFVF